jgi:hypothetical protein
MGTVQYSSEAFNIEVISVLYAEGVRQAFLLEGTRHFKEGCSLTLTEAEFLDVIGTKVFLLAIQSHLY